jgi:glycerol-3-phosphate dehydrogenase
MMDRKSLVEILRNKKEFTWDIIVTGGGATGLGVALDAAERGFSVLLLEKHDFASATSSRSTKLVHGGVRYMAQGDLLLVMEALHERGLMLRNAPHLTANQEFIIPIYRFWDLLMYMTGLKFYDLLAGRLSLGKSYFIGRTETEKRLPRLNPSRLKGGVVYHDGQFDDSRMAVALAECAASYGAVPLNYFEVTGLLKDEAGKIKGVAATDTTTGEKYTVRAGTVINATGVFADSIHRMDDPGARPTIRPSQGVHIVLDRSFLQGDSAVMIPKTDDGRVLFAIPWYGKVVVGTTDTPLDTITMEPKALDSEIRFILGTAGRYLTVAPKMKDVLCVFAGLRPLAADPDNPHATKEVSRRHKITLSPSGLVSVIGGKWTTYRRMAEETLDAAMKDGQLEKRPCNTSRLRLAGDDISGAGRLKIYGTAYHEIEEMISLNPSWGKPLEPGLPYTEAELRWICRNEMPVQLGDLLARRTRALFLDVNACSALAERAAQIMAEEHGHDNKWIRNQLEGFKELTGYYI